MAIRMMTSKDRAHLPNVEFVPHYSSDCDVKYIGHHWDCPNYKSNDPNIRSFATERLPNCHPDCKHHEGLYMETSFVGCVIKTWERNGHDDSDFYALAWNEATQKPETIEYASTRGWSYPNGASVDATPEVLAKYQAWCIEADIDYFLKDQEELIRRPEVGRLCKVVKGRKYPKGLLVTVREKYETVYGMGRWASRTTMAKFKYTHEDGRVDFGATNVENLEVVNPEQYRRSEPDVRAEITAKVKGGGRYASPLFAEAWANRNR